MMFWNRKPRIRPSIAEVCRRLLEEDVWTGDTYGNMVSAGDLMIRCSYSRDSVNLVSIAIGEYDIYARNITRREQKALISAFCYRSLKIQREELGKAHSALESAVLPSSDLKPEQGARD